MENRINKLTTVTNIDIINNYLFSGNIFKSLYELDKIYDDNKDNEEYLTLLNEVIDRAKKYKIDNNKTIVSFKLKETDDIYKDYLNLIDKYINDDYIKYALYRDIYKYCIGGKNCYVEKNVDRFMDIVGDFNEVVRVSEVYFNTYLPIEKDNNFTMKPVLTYFLTVDRSGYDFDNIMHVYVSYKKDKNYKIRFYHLLNFGNALFVERLIDDCPILNNCFELTLFTACINKRAYGKSILDFSTTRNNDTKDLIISKLQDIINNDDYECIYLSEDDMCWLNSKIMKLMI